MRKAYLQRNIAPQNANIEAAYQEVYGDLDHIDEQTAFISPETYKLVLREEYGIARQHPMDASNGKRYEAGKIEESEKYREKFVRNTAWMKDQRAEDVERRKAAWEKGVREGFSTVEE